MQTNTPFSNRITKNLRKISKWLKRERIEAYRLYDKDIPEFPYIVDIYRDYAIIYERGISSQKVSPDIRNKHLNQVFAAIENVLKISSDKIVLKQRQVQKGSQQYEKINTTNNRLIVSEGELDFYVNPFDYLDTGLFLDHRSLRRVVLESNNNKKVLNLFAYTGSISVAAACSGATVTTVDMSNTYINWAKDNFRLNDLRIDDHKFVRENVFDFLRQVREKFDTIILDPPSFSNSKKMQGSFDVQRDHSGLIHMCMKCLNQDGVLFFSNNNRKFKIDAEISNQYEVKDITDSTIPKDFRDRKIHCCFKILNRK